MKYLLGLLFCVGSLSRTSARFFLPSHSEEVSGNVRVMSQNLRNEVENPSFCHILDCPVFKVLSTTDNYQLREYEESRWVSTQIQSLGYDEARATMFMRIYSYIRGNNANNQRVPMTAPLLVRVTPGQGPASENNFTMSFFISPKVNSPPAPGSKNVFLSTLPKQKVFVGTFGGHANQNIWISNADKLFSALDKDDRNFDASYFYTAVYDSPFQSRGRHNEVWLVAKE